MYADTVWNGGSKMGLKESYKELQDRKEALLKAPLGCNWVDQFKRYVHPFRIYGNVWYVGDTWVCVHLIDTGEGLLLIDAGNAGASAMLIQAIWEAGFDPKDVKWIIHSHGHLDHIGASNMMKHLFGTKLYLGEPDAVMFKERPELILYQLGSDFCEHAFEPDGVIRDGDVMTFGNTTIQFYLVPGHTEGTISLFFDIDGEDGVKRAGYFGGFGFNTLETEFLLDYGDPEFRMRRVYLDSLAKVRDQKVDIFLGNHSDNNRVVEKGEFMKAHPEAPNPFIDPEEWGRFLDGRKEAMLQFIKDNEG
ncbi:MAG: MBL fold metallo-hydrolase [Firmicutes bacterium]|nr:MBL fold metallo-hydrolase [Bacillota bacterium]